MANITKLTHRSHGTMILSKVLEAQMQQNPRLAGRGCGGGVHGVKERGRECGMSGGL